MANPHLLNLHRVLTGEGTPAEEFRWPDSADSRDVSTILRAEGLEFDAEGRADPANRLSADDLVEAAGLLEEVTAEDGEGFGSEWSTELIERCFKESPPAMKAVLRFLADNPDRTMMTVEIAEAVDRSPAQLRGVLGAFGRRAKNRYGMDTWFFDADWSDEAASVLYRMPAHGARLIPTEREPG